MSHAKNKIEWCLKKAERELKEKNIHRGLIKTSPNYKFAEMHLKKAEHNLKAITDFKKMGYSDWSASAAFYAAYHCLLAIAAKFGYESRNQECTFALIYNLIEEKKINLSIMLIEEISSLKPEEKQERETIIGLREFGQYGVALSLENEKCNKIEKIAKEILDKTKEIMEE